ncbi:tol-pal system-associated acyl-CoA thioesterase [Flagellatimonas centrodinii]|uniref:tol-pal system-associated acyl-CoA thioesterase n=1 Tax=Flagellatimonas centrodinii TaxID=2806210 RepID=UPI001FF71C23|nr:tol-pal system-associated acyl-CoA thioesterase [Flagellatimonas centrodinii]ULQ46477.1 tol-pal system-associated acyl-CoA thioesterase [Flagellatimonas centrodinii]
MNRRLFPWSVRVYYEDTDASGVTYHANYLRWFERARTEWLRSLGGHQQRMMDEAGIAFTVSHLDVHYRRPARLDDLLRVDTEVTEVRRASLHFLQRIFREADGELLAEARVRAGCVDQKTFRPRALPPLSF